MYGYNLLTFLLIITFFLIFKLFHASWCPKCKRIRPEFYKFAKRVPSGISVADIDCDPYEADCKEFGYTSFPDIVFYSNGL